MPTFKGIVESQKEDGTFRVKILVTQNRKKKRIPTEWYAEKDYLKRVTTKNGNTNYVIKSRSKYDDLVNDKIREYRTICDSTPNIGSMTVDEIVEMLENQQQGGAKLNVTGSTSLNDIVETLTKKSKNDFELDFIEYLMNEYRTMSKLGKNKESTAYSRKVVANSLKKYTRRDTLDVNELTTSFVEGYIKYLKGDNDKYTRKCKAYPTIISALLDKAKYEYNDEENGVVKITVDPFKKIKQGLRNGARKMQFEKVKKRPAIDIKKIQEIINLKTFESRREELGRDMFLLSFMLVGINSVDLFECTDYSKRKLTYFRRKVEERRDDGAKMQIKVESEVLPFFTKYKNLNPMKREVFMFCNQYTDHRNFNKAINKGIKLIGERVGIPDMRYYSARRSWATIARNEIKSDKYDVHEALNHVDGDMKVTDGYIEKNFSVIWDINRQILDLFDWSNLKTQ
jgi:integrase